MKKVLSVALALIMVFSCFIVASADDGATLQFDEKGEFKILHLTDCQDKYPAYGEMMDFINHVLDKYDPDLVVLGGDNTVPDINEDGSNSDVIEKAIAELVAPFVEHETYFTLVFGNHDREGNRPSNDELLKLYQAAGGKYCLAFDEKEELSGSGNHHLSVYSSKDASKVAYNLYMFDSGTGNYKDAEGNDGYECVYADQVQWFEEINDKNIPSMAFQHIIVGEIMDVFYKEAGPLSVYTKFCNGKNYDLLIPDYSAIKSGALTEPPCPGVENHGQFDALVRQNTVAIFSGHDHVNTFTVNLNGVDIVNTAGATFNSYGNDILRGGRLITIKEGTRDYDSTILNLSEEIMNGADINYSKFNAFFGFLLNKIVTAFFALFSL